MTITTLEQLTNFTLGIVDNFQNFTTLAVVIFVMFAAVVLLVLVMNLPEIYERLERLEKSDRYGEYMILREKIDYLEAKAEALLSSDTLKSAQIEQLHNQAIGIRKTLQRVIDDQTLNMHPYSQLILDELVKQAEKQTEQDHKNEEQATTTTALTLVEKSDS